MTMARTAAQAPSTMAQRRGSIGGYTRWSRHDPGPEMARVRAAKAGKLRAAVRADDPGLTDEAEIARRVECRRRAQLQRASLAAATARRAAAKKRRLAAEADLDADSDGVDLDA